MADRCERCGESVFRPPLCEPCLFATSRPSRMEPVEPVDWRSRALQAEVERDEAWVIAERRRVERAQVLDVKTIDGLTASEWLLRAAKAEGERNVAMRLLRDSFPFMESCDADGSDPLVAEVREFLAKHKEPDRG